MIGNIMTSKLEVLTGVGWYHNHKLLGCNCIFVTVTISFVDGSEI